MTCDGGVEENVSHGVQKAPCASPALGLSPSSAPMGTDLGVDDGLAVRAHDVDHAHHAFLALEKRLYLSRACRRGTLHLPRQRRSHTCKRKDSASVLSSKSRWCRLKSSATPINAAARMALALVRSRGF